MSVKGKRSYKRVNAFGIVGEFALTLEDGEMIFDEISPALLDGQNVILDFSEVKIFASTFFNVAIGRLLKSIKPNDLASLLNVINLAPAGQDVMQKVIENSLRYYSDDKYRQAVDDILTERAAGE